MNSFGDKYKISLIGSSHGNLVGVVIDGIPPGYIISEEMIKAQLGRRRPGQSKVTTNRKEADELIIEAGLFNSKTSGEPLVAYIRNKDVDSTYYEEIKDTPRPGHADYPAFVKYKGSNDYRGGGRFSGRLTAGIVIAGSIATQILKQQKVEFKAFAYEINGISGKEERYNLSHEFIYSNENPVRAADPQIVDSIYSRILELKSQGNSCGGIVECRITNLPVGIGEPWFDSIESKISHMIFSIPAVKGIEFGSGFNSVKMLGSEHNDEYDFDSDGKIITKSNNAGGILGGLSDGMPIVFRVAFKPTSSISKQQSTVNKQTGESAALKVRGRHDPCIVPRAVPVVEAAAACVILDLMMWGGFIS